MFISGKQRKNLLCLISMINASLDSREIRESIRFMVMDLLGADFYASFRWDSESNAFTQGVAENMDLGNLSNYDKYYRHLDPITHKLQVKSNATLVTQVIPQNALMNTEFYNDFLQFDGLHYGINLFVYDGTQNIGDIRLWRQQGSGNFDDESLYLLELIKPHLCNALRNAICFERISKKHELLAEGNDSKGQQNKGQGNNEQHNNGQNHALEAEQGREDTLLFFAQSKFGLTKREAQIACNVMRGNGDKCIAKDLNITYSTLRTHIKNIYRKPDINNRTQLSYLITH